MHIQINSVPFFSFESQQQWQSVKFGCRIVLRQQLANFMRCCVRSPHHGYIDSALFGHFDGLSRWANVNWGQWQLQLHGSFLLLNHFILVDGHWIWVLSWASVDIGILGQYRKCWRKPYCLGGQYPAIMTPHAIFYPWYSIFPSTVYNLLLPGGVV